MKVYWILYYKLKKEAKKEITAYYRKGDTDNLNNNNGVGSFDGLKLK